MILEEELADQKAKATTAALRVADKLLVDKENFVSFDSTQNRENEADSTTT